jgi:hypothetical protein
MTYLARNTVKGVSHEILRLGPSKSLMDFNLFILTVLPCCIEISHLQQKRLMGKAIQLIVYIGDF